MAIRRTLKQKQKVTVQREQNFQYSLPRAADSKNTGRKTKISNFVNVSNSASPVLGAPSSSKIFGYDVALIYRDLVKTTVVAALVVVVLIGITVIK